MRACSSYSFPNRSRPPLRAAGTRSYWSLVTLTVHVFEGSKLTQQSKGTPLLREKTKKRALALTEEAFYTHTIGSSLITSARIAHTPHLQPGRCAGLRGV